MKKALLASLLTAEAFSGNEEPLILTNPYKDLEYPKIKDSGKKWKPKLELTKKQKKARAKSKRAKKARKKQRKGN